MDWTDDPMLNVNRGESHVTGYVIKSFDKMPGSELNLKVNLTYGDDYIQDIDSRSKQLMFIFWGIIMPIISVIGFVGNILTIIVLFRREMKSTTVYFLRTLVVTDTGIIVGAIMGLSVISITQLNKDMWRFTDVIYPHIFTPTNYIVMTLQMLNVWTTVAVSVERYIAICHPFKSVRICNKKNAYIMIGSITVVSILYNIPRCFAITTTECGKADHPCYVITTTEFGKHHFYSEIYSVWLYMLLIYIIPLVLLGVLNTLLIVELMRMRRRRSITNVQENTEQNMSIVLILIVIVFIFCQTPGLVAQFQFLGPLLLLQWTCVSNTLFVLNSSVNFLIYTAVGRKFRKILLKTFQVLIKRPVNELKTSYSQGHYSANGQTEMTKLNSKAKICDTEDVADETCMLKACGR